MAGASFREGIILGRNWKVMPIFEFMGSKSTRNTIEPPRVQDAVLRMISGRIRHRSEANFEDAD